MPCSRQLALVHLRQAHLADRRGGLQFVQLLRPGRPARAASCPRRWRRWTPSRPRGPGAASAASCRHQLPIASASTPRPSLVTRLEPTLTTMRRACLQRPQPSQLVLGREIEASDSTGAARSRRGHVVVHRVHAAGPGPSRVSAEISNTGPFQRKRLTKSLHPRLALVLPAPCRSCSAPASAAWRAAAGRTSSAPRRSHRPAPPGRRVSSNGAMSTTCSSSRVRCRCRRN